MGLLARCQNAHLGRFENFWSSEATSVVRLVEANDIVEDLVDAVEEWPGLTTFDATISGGHITATRPKHFFRDDAGMPEVISLPIARPHGFQHLGQSEWANLVTERVRVKEADHRQRRAAKGITVLGHERILRQDPFDCPPGHAPRFQMSPQVAAKNKWARIEALLRNRGFIDKYRTAFLAHLAGLANVLFPFGTYWMRKIAKVACEAAEIVGAATQDPAAIPTPA
ncbi:MAG TPA: hypothetical protein VF550_19840 [Polyangia bacterium]